MSTEPQILPNRRNAPKLVRPRRILPLESCVLSLVSCFLYICRVIITFVERALQISSFMQNKANFPESQMNINKEMAREYEKKTLGERGKNKANSKPNKANLLNAQMNVKSFLIVDYENKSNWAICENKANTKPIKANIMPKQTQYKAKQSQFHPPGIGGFCFFETPIMIYVLRQKRIKNPLQLRLKVSRLSKRRCYKSLKKVIEIKCPTLKRF